MPSKSQSYKSNWKNWASKKLSLNLVSPKSSKQPKCTTWLSRLKRKREWSVRCKLNRNASTTWTNSAKTSKSRRWLPPACLQWTKGLHLCGRILPSLKTRCQTKTRSNVTKSKRSQPTISLLKRKKQPTDRAGTTTTMVVCKWWTKSYQAIKLAKPIAKNTEDVCRRQSSSSTRICTN